MKVELLSLYPQFDWTADEVRTRNILVGSQMLYQLNYCCIVYPKSTSISDILPLTFIQRPRCIRNSVGGVRKPYWLQETVTIRPTSAYEADDEPLLYPAILACDIGIEPMT